ncbi:Rid family hydrolase [Ancylobacter defluvii]|uniref:Uncharacterized protein n=1 Tax=Ancylobacter defluvii TaxID=1282440 RepID=A0A9W6JWH6_9HYPH|nr:Rid family hydrolase [Ancylobacter defluvii]GLK82658.1 hypothetical protein GCM10017653_07270 [Ancylobacter defluvii]
MEKPEFFVTPGYGELLRDLLHYSQSVRIGKRVEILGQGRWDDNLRIPDALEEEIAQALRNVERTLATASAGWEHVVHVNSYHVGGFPRRSTRRWRGSIASICPIMRRSGRRDELEQLGAKLVRSAGPCIEEGGFGQFCHVCLLS